MNYKEFMQAVDERLSVMSETEKDEWIHHLSRTIKEQQRSTFLQSLTVTEQQEIPEDNAINEIEDWCSKIEAHDIYLECTGYEVYGESFWDRDWEYEYTDIFGIGTGLGKAFQKAEILLYQKRYEHALELYERLCCLSIPTIDRDAGEYNELELKDLVEEDLVKLDLKQIILNLMYVKYQVSGGEDRVDSLYRYFSWDMYVDIKIEDMFIVGPEELVGIDQFMEEWISFLKNKDGDRAADLLMEACIYHGGNSLLTETASKIWGRHPVLYEYACKNLLSEKKMSDCERLGLEAIRVLSEKLIIRGKIAGLAAQAAAQLGHVESLIECCEAAFYANSTLNNYLRLFDLPDHQNKADRAAKYAMTISEDLEWGRTHYNNQMQMNSLSKDRKKVLRFFNGELDYIFEECKNDKTTLGWSSHFKGIAVPLFILLLDKNNKITQAGQQLMDGLIHRLGYVEEGTQKFSDQFLCWKDKVVLTNEQYDKYIVWLEDVVDQRTEAVVGGGYRGSYYKAAALIEALGETLESNGSLRGKANLIEYYKRKHSRKRAFKAEFKM